MIKKIIIHIFVQLSFGYFCLLVSDQTLLPFLKQKVILLEQVTSMEPEQHPPVDILGNQQPILHPPVNFEFDSEPSSSEIETDAETIYSDGSFYDSVSDSGDDYLDQNQVFLRRLAKQPPIPRERTPTIERSISRSRSRSRSRNRNNIDSDISSGPSSSSENNNNNNNNSNNRNSKRKNARNKGRKNDRNKPKKNHINRNIDKNNADYPNTRSAMRDRRESGNIVSGNSNRMSSNSNNSPRIRNNSASNRNQQRSGRSRQQEPSVRSRGRGRGRGRPRK